MSLISNFKVVHRRGKNYITCTKHSGSNSSSRWDIYRSDSPITSLGGLTKITRIDPDSWHSLYNDVSVSKRLSLGFIIPGASNESPHQVGTVTLDDTQCLFVLTTHASGSYYYCIVSNDDATVTLGVNSLSSPIVETLPGDGIADIIDHVIIDIIDNSTYLTYKFCSWGDVETWQSLYWGGNFNRWNCYDPGGIDVPIRLLLHAAGAGYNEPADTVSSVTGLTIFPIDLDMQGFSDPYALSDPTYDHSYHFGRYSPITDLFHPITEDRYYSYVKYIRDDFFFVANPLRVGVEGASLGGAAYFVAAHNPAMFASANAQLVTSRFIRNTNAVPGVTLMAPNSAGLGGGVIWDNWEDFKWLADNGYRIPPTNYTFNKDDGTLSPYYNQFAVPAFNSAMWPIVTQWHDGNHGAFDVGFAIDTPNSIGSGKQRDPFRFHLGEAFPVFYDAGTSDDIGVIDFPKNETGAPGNSGQVGYWFDWQSDFHSIPGGSDIIDLRTEFSISLISYNGSTVVGVAIQNTQLFRPNVGSRINWVFGNQSGTAIVLNNIIIPIPLLNFTTSAKVLTLTSGSNPTTKVGWLKN